MLVLRAALALIDFDSLCRNVQVLEVDLLNILSLGFLNNGSKCEALEILLNCTTIMQLGRILLPRSLWIHRKLALRAFALQEGTQSLLSTTREILRSPAL